MLTKGGENMKYKKILKQISAKEKTSVKEIEYEMQKAITAAGYNCSVKDFIEMATAKVKQRLYIV